MIYKATYSGVPRSGSKLESDGTDRSANPIVFEFGQILIHGASEEYTFRACVCPSCRKMRRQRDCRTQTIRTLFGTVTAPLRRGTPSHSRTAGCRGSINAIGPGICADRQSL